jgi:hypothetical protein
MRKTVLRRVEALERQLPPLPRVWDDSERTFYIDYLMLAYYVGGLKRNEYPSEAFVRALGFNSVGKYLQTQRDDPDEYERRRTNARRRLFAQVGLDMDQTPLDALVEAYMKLAEQFPEDWVTLIEKARSAEDLFRLWGEAVRSWKPGSVVEPQHNGKAQSEVEMRS